MSLDNIQSFSQQSDRYARHRPTYPEELYQYLSGLLEQHDSAWDCATGSGQAALALTRYFTSVQASDMSQEQLEHSLPHARITYRVSPAEKTPYNNDSFDMVVVAQAVHWFNPEKFHPELLRVLKPGGIYAIWGYSSLLIQPDIDSLIESDLSVPLDPFWADGNRQLMAGYKNYPFPLEEIINPPAFEMCLDWTLDQLIEYLRTWSAVKRYSAEFGTDPLLRLKNNLSPVWGAPDQTRTIHMPLAFRLGRKLR